MLDWKNLFFAMALTPLAVSRQMQSPAVAVVRPVFEVASIKANNSAGRNSVQFGPDSLTIIHLPLANILIQAYSLPPEQMSFGPFDSLFEQRYDIVAKAAGRVHRDQMRLMLQTLLADRFHLVVHHEQRLVQGYALLVDKSGPKLQSPTEPDAEADFDKHLDANAPRQTIKFKNATMALLAQILAEAADMSKLRPGGSSPTIVDMTGIRGGFDFALEWTLEEAAAGDTSPPEKLPAMIAGLHKLGLTMKSQKVPIDILVVDHVDKEPTGN
jgi:uncharacterized protein (TIGR03435 family)